MIPRAVRSFQSASNDHLQTNCLAEVLFEEALARAAELDEYMQEHGKPLGPLHGLPLSVKEHIFVRNSTATSGLIAWADQTSPEDAIVVAILRDAGAIPFVKTTNPQCLMALETVSNLFGRTLNPHNTNLTSGGSSGGEAALIAMRGTPLGIGTDIGGSIRVPSAFCGTYGLKPSVGRMPHGGLSGLHDGMQNIVGVVGPMASSIDDLELFCSAVLGARPWEREPAVFEKPWASAGRTNMCLRVGVMHSDGVVQPHPPVSRALEDVVGALRRAGHIVLDWDPKLHKRLSEVANVAYFLDGGEEYSRRLMEGHEPPVAILRSLLNAYSGGRKSLEESWMLNRDIGRLQAAYLQQWNDAQLDCLICPISPSVASVHDESMYWGYTSVFNVLDYPVSCIPIGKVNDSDNWASFPSAKIPSGPLDAWHRSLYKDPEASTRYQNSPTSVQIVGRRLREEELLSMTRLIERALEDSMDRHDASPTNRDDAFELPSHCDAQTGRWPSRPLL